MPVGIDTFHPSTEFFPSAYDDQLEDEDYDLIAENTGIQLQRKKFRRVHGNVLDSDEEEGGESGHAESAAPAAINTSFTREESMDSTQDEDFAHVSRQIVACFPEMTSVILKHLFTHSRFLLPLLPFPPSLLPSSLPLISSPCSLSCAVQVFGGDSDEDDVPDSQGGSAAGAPGEGRRRGRGRAQLEEDEEDVDDEFDFIVDDHGQPIRRRKEDGTYTEP